MGRQYQKGQSILLVVIACGLFLIGALGLVIDGAHVYAQRQLAQDAADAAAQAGAMSIFAGTNATAPSPFGTGGSPAAFTCDKASATTPCVYAGTNGFNSADVAVDFPPKSMYPGVNFSSDAANPIRVTINHQLDTTLMRLLGASAANVKAIGVAAIVNVVSPTPIIITHPKLPDALSMNGNTLIKICGGPGRSIQVNSSDPNSVRFPNSGKCGGGNPSGCIDLSHAGTSDPGNCTTGTGADFGTFGGPNTPQNVDVGTTGRYVQPSAPITDPLANVFPNGPPVPANNGSSTSVPTGTDGCTSGPCTEYSPGLYAGGINEKGHHTVIFRPGLYYIEGGGFTLKQVTAQMCPPSSCAPDPATVNGMVVYNTGPKGTTGTSTPAGAFTIDTLTNADFWGAGMSITCSGGNCQPTAGVPPAPPYYGILFFQDRTSQANTHILGQGNGCFTVIGTIYITNSLAIMTANPSQYQSVEFHGTPCAGTMDYGQIIVSQLTLKGTAQIDMNLFPYGFLNLRQVALIH